MTDKTTTSISDYEAWVQSREQHAIGTNCGWCGRGLPGGAPPLIDRIAALEAELAERTRERDEVAANLANTQIMFEDWKVVHSTIALEVAFIRERERRWAAEWDAELLWANCRVIYFPDPPGSYPLEHNFRWVGKDSRTDIEAALRIDAARKERT